MSTIKETLGNAPVHMQCFVPYGLEQMFLTLGRVPGPPFWQVYGVILETSLQNAVIYTKH
jgi:hypothetical protein